MFVIHFISSTQDCIGVIDGMHIPAHVPAKEQSQFRNKKGLLSQNVLAACTFDLQFIFIYPGWEGSVADSRVLRAVLDDPDQNFPHIPEGSSKIEMLQKHATYCTYILGFSSLILMIKSSMFQEIITWLIWITQTQKDLLLHT